MCLTTQPLEEARIFATSTDIFITNTNNPDIKRESSKRTIECFGPTSPDCLTLDDRISTVNSLGVLFSALKGNKITNYPKLESANTLKFSATWNYLELNVVSGRSRTSSAVKYLKQS
jgi:hypothetical protein